MNLEIARLQEVRKGDVSSAGGKGANLGEMAGQGFPVPPGFVVLAPACRHFFEVIRLAEACRVLPDLSPEELDQRCSSLRALIEKAELPSTLAAAILAEHVELTRGRGHPIVCAVRSSATAEDLAGASFAGQHGTYYYVDEKRLLSMIKHCWASLWSPEAVSYRTTQGLAHDSVFMAVVVQEMVRSEVSGVTFTANPVTGAKDEIVIESSWGMGAAIVDGRVTPDHFILERDGLRLREKRIAEKRFLVPSFLREGAKQRLEPVPHTMRHKPTLSPDQARTVAEWALKTEQHFGCPQDVEWALADNQFYLLQSRPITIMGQQEFCKNREGGKYVFFKQVAENFTDPLTPLSQDLMLGSALVSSVIRVIGGRPYLDLNTLAKIVPLRMSDEDWAKTLFMDNTEPPQVRLAPEKLPMGLLMSLFDLIYFGHVFRRSSDLPVDFMDGFRDRARRVDEDPALGFRETWRRLLFLPDFFDPIGNYALPVNLSSVRYALYLGLLGSLLKRWFPELSPEVGAALISGTEGVLSAQTGLEIWELARSAKRSEKVRELLLNHKPEKVWSELQAEPAAGEFLARLDRFLARYGHRAIKEIELRSTRWEENPAPILGMVRNYLLAETDPLDHEQKVAETRKKHEREIHDGLQKFPLERTLGLRWRLLEYLAGRAKYFTRLRENSRFYWIMGYYGIRKKVLRAEAELIGQGRLKCKDDVFFLHWDELEDMQAGRLGWREVEDRIRERRLEYVRLSKVTPPKSVGIKVLEKPRPSAAESGGGQVLHGQAASAGVYEGSARVIINPSADLELRPGEVLVAPYTDPAWTPLFLTAGAAVVEVGSFLSHAGTVAREYGMPCVVEVDGCTRRLHTGDRLRVDGDKGTVELLAP